MTTGLPPQGRGTVLKHLYRYLLIDSWYKMDGSIMVQKEGAILEIHSQNTVCQTKVCKRKPMQKETYVAL